MPISTMPAVILTTARKEMPKWNRGLRSRFSAKTTLSTWCRRIRHTRCTTYPFA
ncbi:hypothetical protein HMPREF0239_02461 [Clostridium sp. ATCC BAA-442]|nr:hypothetical protein HMPREF0239_02461 [Clostridium sp. ATCC BAA-442]